MPPTHLTTPPPPRETTHDAQRAADLIDEHLAHADDVRPPLAHLFRLEEQLAPVRRRLRLDRLGRVEEAGEDEEEEEEEEEEGDGRRGQGGEGSAASSGRVASSRSGRQ